MSDGAHDIETNILAAEVLKAIGRLPEAQREAVFLVYAEGYSYAEAASAPSVPIGTIMTPISRLSRSPWHTFLASSSAPIRSASSVRA